MAHGKSQRLRFKRRRNGKTDYRRRLRMLRGGVPRAIVRVSNTQVVCQLAQFDPEGDRIVASVNGSNLASYGWPAGASTKSVPACYISGYALGKSALSAGHDSAILDIGLAASSPGNRIFAALKGMVDAGLEVPHGDNVLPSDDRINGAHIDESLAAAVESAKKAIEEASG
ncbi:MAG: 50S ribosomal protein L18 [Candidatus Thermoplasmatota archaeon]|nr:50S ribosomal protein L18 [Candidatus Thermoplasmatota archaeon]MEE3315913.1 50S ribosomal protein L18 [Candidatus Thermoplasmatota archaeon]